MAVLLDQTARSRPEIDEALVPLLGEQHSVEPGHALGIDLAGALAGHLDL